MSVTPGLNPPAFSPGAFVHIFTQDPSVKIVPKFFPEGSKRWFDNYLRIPYKIMKDLRSLGSVESLMTTSVDDALAWYARHNMPPPIAGGKETLYIGAVFDFMMDWREGPSEYQRHGKTYLKFNGNDLEFKSSFGNHGGYLPAPEGTYAWVCMPDRQINNAANLMDFVNTVEQRELNAPTDYSQQDYDFSLHVPAFAVRSDISNDPPIDGVIGDMLPMRREVEIAGSSYSNRIVFNEKGAYMRSVMTYETAPTAMPFTKIRKRVEVIIDKPFVFVARAHDLVRLVSVPGEILKFSSKENVEYLTYTS